MAPRSGWVALVLACALPACGGDGAESCPPAEDGSPVVGPAGGVLRIGEAEFHFPPGALPVCQPFQVAMLPPGSQPGVGPEGGYQITPDRPLSKSVIVYLPLDPSGTPDLATIGRWTDSSEWSPLHTIPSPDRRKLVTRARGLGNFAVGPAPAPMCGFTCGGEVEGSWELSGLCSRLVIDKRCPQSSGHLALSIAATFEGGRFREEGEAGPGTLFAPRGCLPAYQVGRCEDLGRVLSQPGFLVTCSEISDSECGCGLELAGGATQVSGQGTYTIDGKDLVFTGSRVERGFVQTMSSEPTPFCREGDRLALFVNFTAVNVFSPAR